MPIVDIDQLKALVAILDHGSLSAAARALHRTQPSITRLIQSLEVEMGGPLLDRSSRPPRPTPRGLEAIESARKVLEALGEFELLGRSRKRRKNHPFRIGLSHALVRMLGQPDLVAWHRTQVRMDLQVTTGWSLDLIRQMKEQRLDAVIGPFAPDWQPPPGLYGTPLGQDVMALACPSGTKLPKVLALSNLVDQPWVLNAEGCGTRRAVERACAEAGATLVPVVEATGDFGVLLDFVAAGLGITLAPSLMIRQHPHAKRMGLHPLQGNMMGIAFWLCWREASPALRTHLEALDKALRAAFSKFCKPSASRAKER